MFAHAWKNRSLIWQLLKRDVQARYRGSALGLLWSLVTPIVMLSIYTFVFQTVFKFFRILFEKDLTRAQNQTAAYMGFVLWWADEQGSIFNFSIGLLVWGELMLPDSHPTQSLFVVYNPK